MKKKSALTKKLLKFQSCGFSCVANKRSPEAAPKKHMATFKFTTKHYHAIGIL